MNLFQPSTAKLGLQRSVAAHVVTLDRVQAFKSPSQFLAQTVLHQHNLRYQPHGADAPCSPSSEGVENMRSALQSWWEQQQQQDSQLQPRHLNPGTVATTVPRPPVTQQHDSAQLHRMLRARHAAAVPAGQLHAGMALARPRLSRGGSRLIVRTGSGLSADADRASRDQARCLQVLMDLQHVYSSSWERKSSSRRKSDEGTGSRR